MAPSLLLPQSPVFSCCINLATSAYYTALKPQGILLLGRGRRRYAVCANTSDLSGDVCPPTLRVNDLVLPV